MMSEFQLRNYTKKHPQLPYVLHVLNIGTKGNITVYVSTIGTDMATIHNIRNNGPMR